MVPPIITPKPFLEYTALINLLVQRGMQVIDRSYAERKLAQVGYYRLSGYWFPCRSYTLDANQTIVLNQHTKKPLRSETVEPGTDFKDIFQLYLMDKKLRILILDAIERVEIYLRSIIAHEMGRLDAMAHQNVSFINPKQARNFTDNKTGKTRNIWEEWLDRHQKLIDRSQEDCIVWHKRAAKPMPFWVVIEAWDFGTLSKYFEILNRAHQNAICSKLGIHNPIVLKQWLQGLNTLRNRCAHHVRIWNQVSSNPLQTLPDLYFQNLALDKNSLSRLYGLICILWFLIKKIGPNSQWLINVADVISTKPTIPNCPFTSMGLPDNSGFPRAKFGF